MISEKTGVEEFLTQPHPHPHGPILVKLSLLIVNWIALDPKKKVASELVVVQFVYEHLDA
jgi:hypothetical protein